MSAGVVKSRSSVGGMVGSRNTRVVGIGSRCTRVVGSRNRSTRVVGSGSRSTRVVRSRCRVGAVAVVGIKEGVTVGVHILMSVADVTISTDVTDRLLAAVSTRHIAIAD